MPVEGVFHNLVITQINKEYAGQGQKVMNAMWGAGQMMFNKILVLTDGKVPITNYEALAQYVFSNLNPATDINFSQGPMDVLDHSCSKLGFGGKMCIDGTFKFDEEKDDQYDYSLLSEVSLKTFLLNTFSEITIANDALLKRNIPVLLLSVKKNRPNHLKELHEAICKHKEIEGVKMILYVEHNVDSDDLPVALWRFCNNLDPKRDNLLVERASMINGDKKFACIGLDGTRKTKAFDNFMRPWPNIIVASDETISAVDSKWNELGLGTLLTSPSRKFKDQMYGDEAEVE